MLPGIGNRIIGIDIIPPTVTYLGASVVGGNPTYSYGSFTAPRSGLFVFCHGNGNSGAQSRAISSASIGGVGASIIANFAGWGSTGIVTREVAAGTYAVVVSMNGNTGYNAVGYAFLLENYRSPTPVLVSGIAQNSTTTSNSVVINVPMAAAGIVGHYHFTVNSVTWTGATKIAENGSGGNQIGSSAIFSTEANLSTGRTVTASWPSTGDQGSGISLAVWQ